jgi:probable rRNA maturation factor
MTRKPTGGKVAVSNRQRRCRIDTKLLAEIAAQALKLVHADQTQLSVVLVNDAMIAKLNARYHDTQAPTDILSFDYGRGQGELIISVEQAIAHARCFRSTPARELVLYVAHGILHLHGYDDVKPLDRRRMRAAERRLMSHLCKHFEFKSLISRKLPGGAACDERFH